MHNFKLFIWSSAYNKYFYFLINCSYHWIYFFYYFYFFFLEIIPFLIPFFELVYKITLSQKISRNSFLSERCFLSMFDFQFLIFNKFRYLIFFISFMLEQNIEYRKTSRHWCETVGIWNVKFPFLFLVILLLFFIFFILLIKWNFG